MVATSSKKLAKKQLGRGRVFLAKQQAKNDQQQTDLLIIFTLLLVLLAIKDGAR